MPFLPRNPEHHTADVIALHRATLENPLDDTPHLVYADAMDDAGAHEEAGTLRRLVKLRAAIGNRPTHVPRSGEAVGDLHGKILGTDGYQVGGVRTVPDMMRVERSGPHIILPHAYVRKLPGTEGRYTKVWQRDRTLRIVPETGGAAVTYSTDSDHHDASGVPPVPGMRNTVSRIFIHSRDVASLLGEHDAQ